MRRPIINSGEAKLIVYASKAGEEVSAWDLIRACENRERHMRTVLQREGKLITKVFRLANDQGDIEITARWVELGVKPTKHYRRSLAKMRAVLECEL